MTTALHNLVVTIPPGGNAEVAVTGTLFYVVSVTPALSPTTKITVTSRDRTGDVVFAGSVSPGRWYRGRRASPDIPREFNNLVFSVSGLTESIKISYDVGDGDTGTDALILPNSLQAEITNTIDNPVPTTVQNLPKLNNRTSHNDRKNQTNELPAFLSLSVDTKLSPNDVGNRFSAGMQVLLLNPNKLENENYKMYFRPTWVAIYYKYGTTAGRLRDIPQMSFWLQNVQNDETEVPLIIYAEDQVVPGWKQFMAINTTDNSFPNVGGIFCSQSPYEVNLLNITDAPANKPNTASFKMSGGFFTPGVLTSGFKVEDKNSEFINNRVAGSKTHFVGGDNNDLIVARQSLDLREYPIYMKQGDSFTFGHVGSIVDITTPFTMRISCEFRGWITNNPDVAI